jgi:sulfite exporter TauE/SafE/copper chaperone CopZ
MTKKHIYYIKGMHCASCEVLIEKRLFDIKGIRSAEAKTSQGEVLIEYEDKKPKIKTLNSIFKKQGYTFFDQPQEIENSFKKNNFLKIFIISALLIIGFLYLGNLGLFNWISVNPQSSLLAFFIVGLLAGVSTCAAMTGGLVLSMSKQWSDLYSRNQSDFLDKFKPHLMFNTGRIISFALFGAILGILGDRLQISLEFTAFLVIAVSVLMFLLALQMLGVKNLQRFQPGLPKFVTRYISNETNFKGRYMPFLMGALTFFIPCGFTITVQGLALLSGSPFQGGLIMTFFALGNAPTLLFIGFSAVKFLNRSRDFAYQFSKVAAILIIFFVLFNINSQLIVLGYPNFNDLAINFNRPPPDELRGLAPIINGKQIIRMDAFAFEYSPNYFTVRANVPVRWEISDRGTSGCTNAIIARTLFRGEIPLTPGQTSIKEFTPTQSGRHTFSCWMGMVPGTIEVIADTEITQPITQPAPSPLLKDRVCPIRQNNLGCPGCPVCPGR